MPVCRIWLAWHRRAFQVTPADRASAQATLGFDAAVWELWSYLSCGASLHLAEERFETMRKHCAIGSFPEGSRFRFAATAMAESLAAAGLAERPLRFDSC